jgi:SRSO17 transposase
MMMAAEYDDAHTGRWTRGLLIRRNIADGDLAFFATWCPAGTGIETLVKVEGHRWGLKTALKARKTSWGSTTTRRARGTDGIATSRS